MHEGFKRVVRKVVPRPAIDRVRIAYAGWATRSARAAFRDAAREPLWLDGSMIPSLLQRFPTVPPYPYDPHALWIRGAERYREMRPFLTGSKVETLELACHDGMVSFHLARHGARATALDFSNAHFDARAANAGVQFFAGNAERLPFDSDSFDLVFSYNAFEHFAHPEAVLREAIRVVKPGGTLYFSFGPLYRSAYGLHAMHSITIPYCHHLFQRSDLDEYIDARSLGRIEYETLNEWTLKQFRNLWKSVTPWAETLMYREIPSLHGMPLIEKYPSCFRSKVESFEDLLVAVIEIAMRRTDRLLSTADLRT
jgi:ubiquinone/menaquinone biosynthesis C-methylase UbiE